MVISASSTTTALLPESPSCCPSCGYTISPLEQPSTQLLEAQARIAELETQVCLLNQKATAAVGRWAEYEAELSKLRAQPDPSTVQSPTRASFLQTGATRLSAFVYPRKSQATLRATDATVIASSSRATNPLASPPGAALIQSPTSGPASPTAEDLMEALSREQGLRRAAEGRLSATSKEVEELSAALFEQANEMVADERRARAKLEQRVGELEKRDEDKKRRLDRLEVAMDRIERVRNLLEER